MILEFNVGFPYCHVQTIPDREPFQKRVERGSEESGYDCADFLFPDTCSYTICDSPFWPVAVLLQMGSHPLRGLARLWVLNSTGHRSMMM